MRNFKNPHDGVYPAAKAASSQVTDAVPNGFFISSKSENDTTAGVISHLAERPGFEPGAR